MTEYLSIKQMADRSGFKAITIQRAIWAGELKATRPGGKAPWRATVLEFEKYMEGKKSLIPAEVSQK